ncbi:peptidase inhibitor family I36 protein [Actinoallomurus purpureus]|uniref:peptidase inhibitor family I36 protein n=1 Tax=Actinoallomurus purpureus TaxID=478114 RepID=UPI002093C114|nr:peptidase inhibitor family I36 protein [Actinoallomurus purpureus]MCO6010424.1 peptidase inhibitor family I36 protein [Actinoallomurus purpureus]
MKKMTGGALLAGLVLLGLSGAPAAQADSRNASDIAHVTSTKYLCIYQNDNYGGGRFCVAPRGSGFTTVDLPGKHWQNKSGRVDNAASSMKNATRCKARLRDTRYYGAKEYYVKPGPNSNDADLTKNKNNPRFDNKTSQIVIDCPR